MSVAADVAVVVPIKSFALAKTRLADSLSPDSRRTLAQRCAEVVLRAAVPLPVFVVCNDDEVAEWARAHGASVVVPAVPGLNAAAIAGRDAARIAGYRRLMVVHSDLPHAKDLASLCAASADVVVVPDRHGDGTNVLLLPCAGDFTFQYGPGSCAAHLSREVAQGVHRERAEEFWRLDRGEDLVGHAGSRCAVLGRRFDARSARFVRRVGVCQRFG